MSQSHQLLEKSKQVNNSLNEMVEYLQDEADSIKKSKSKRQVLKGMGVLLALPAGVPFTPLARAFATEDKITYGYFLAAGTVLCYANLALFSYLNLVDEVACDFNHSRLQLMGRSKKAVKGKWLASFVLASLSCVPSMYLAYNYNDNNGVWLIVNFVSSMGFRTYCKHCLLALHA